MVEGRAAREDGALASVSRNHPNMMVNEIETENVNENAKHH